MSELNNKRTAEASEAYAALLAVCRRLHFEPHEIAWQLDSRGHYDLQLEREFPFRIRLFHTSSKQYTSVANWHKHLELILPLDGPIRIRTGEQSVSLAAGELLVVDNLKLHNLEDFPGFKTRLVDISFLPEFVYGSGSPSCDYAFLIPFYAKREGHPHILRGTDELAAPVYQALAELLERCFRSGQQVYAQAGCKATFLQLLYLLTRQFQAAEVLHSEYLQHRQQADRLARIFEYVRQNYAERITIAQATQIVHMSQAQFMKVFKKVSGMTFVAHVTRVRIMNALRSLRETDLTIAEIAMQCGFSDQSYFDRRFREAFGKSPRDWRKSHLSNPTASAKAGKQPRG